jgi:hypothetical protein
MTLLYILLAIIAYFLWKLYRQKEDEEQIIADEKSDAEYENHRKERFKDFPHLFNKIDDTWIQVFASHGETPGHLLKMMFYLMLGESTKIDFSDGSMKWDTLWDCSKELLEHLDKYHDGTTIEHEIALCTYWQTAATRMGELIQERPNTQSLSSDAHTAEIEGVELEKAPFTDIEEIVSLFPKKTSHPNHEITFFNKDGSFPRESEGSVLIDEKMREFGI